MDGASERNDTQGLAAYIEAIARQVQQTPEAWVRCELHNLSTPAGKWARLELVDHDSAGVRSAKVQASCTPEALARILSEFEDAGVKLEAGLKVLVKARPVLNPSHGFSLKISAIDPSYTLGDLRIRAEAIRKALKAAGLWDKNRNLAQPRDFERVAVISPAGAAGLGDFRTLADPLEKHGLVRFDYHEAAFQTPSAPAEIVKALRSIYLAARRGDYCAVAITRGGGASADLAWLIDKDLATAVCHMPVPVITGIGHERDKNLLDEVACIPCATPSLAANHIHEAVVGAARAGAHALAAVTAFGTSAVSANTNAVVQERHSARAAAATLLRTAEKAVALATSATLPDARRSIARSARLAPELASAVRARARLLREAGRDGLAEIAAVTAAAARSSVRAPRDALAATRRALDRAPGPLLTEAAALVAQARRSADTAIDAAAAPAAARLARVTSEISASAARLPEAAGQALAAAAASVRTGASRQVGAAGLGVLEARALADALDPARTIAAGFTVLRLPSGAPATSADAVRRAGIVTAEMRDGMVELIHTDDRGGS